MFENQETWTVVRLAACAEHPEDGCTVVFEFCAGPRLREVHHMMTPRGALCHAAGACALPQDTSSSWCDWTATTWPGSLAHTRVRIRPSTARCAGCPRTAPSGTSTRRTRLSGADSSLLTTPWAPDCAALRLKTMKVITVMGR